MGKEEDLKVISIPFPRRQHGSAGKPAGTKGLESGPKPCLSLRGKAGQAVFLLYLSFPFVKC